MLAFARYVSLELAEVVTLSQLMMRPEVSDHDGLIPVMPPLSVSRPSTILLRALLLD